MIKLEKCPHCGSDVILCSLNGLTYMAYEFSIVCPGCGLETRITYNPSANCCFDKGEAVKQIVEKWNRREALDALNMAASALRPVSREQVERIRGEWVAKHRHRGGFRRVTGVDDMGEQRTITIDERCEYDDRYCSRCGKQSPDNFLNFCGYCGAPMTDEAVDMVMERLEALKDGDLE